MLFFFFWLITTGQKKKLHPDKTGGDEAKTKEFQQVNKAYETLSDAEKRKEYDVYGHQAYERNEKGGGGGGGGGGFQQQGGYFHGGSFQGGGFENIFSQFFSGGGGGGGFHFQFGGDDDDDFLGGGGGGGGGGGRHFHHQRAKSSRHQKLHKEMFGGKTNVTLLDDESHQTEVMGTHKAWLVMYFSERCSHCHTFAPEFEKLATKLKNVIRVGAVDCLHHHAACENVDEFPTIVLFSGEEEDTEGDRVWESHAQVYKGKRTAEKLGNWVLNHLPSNVNHPGTWQAFQKEFVQGRDFLQLPTCVLISNRASPSPLFAALSRDWAKDFDFLFVSLKDPQEDVKQILSALGVDAEPGTFPMLMVKNFVVKGAVNEVLSGALDFERMSEFLQAYALAMAQLKKYGRKKPSHYDEKIYAVSQEEWDNICSPTGAWLCVIGVDINTGHLPLLADAAKRFSKDPGKFMYLFPDTVGPFEDAVRRVAHGSTSGPALVVLNRKKHRIIRLEDAFEATKLGTFLEGIFSGSAGSTKWESTASNDHSMF